MHAFTKRMKMMGPVHGERKEGTAGKYALVQLRQSLTLHFGPTYPSFQNLLELNQP